MKPQDATPTYIGDLNGTPLGDFRFAASDWGLLAIEWAAAQPEFDSYLARLKRPIQPNPKKIAPYAKELREYLNGKRTTFTIPIDWTPFTQFQREALQAVFRIPYGETRTYIDIAREIIRPHAYRAVGAANAMNLMPIIVTQSSTALGVQWRRVLSPTDELRLRYGYTEDWAYGRYWRQQSITTESGAPAPIRYSYDPGGRSMLHEFELEHRLAFSRSLRGVWGLGAKYTEVTSYAQFSQSGWQDLFAYRGFGNLEYSPWEPLLLNAGASLEHDSKTGGMFDPRLSVSYHVLPGHTLRLAASRAHRNPRPLRWSLRRAGCRA